MMYFDVILPISNFICLRVKLGYNGQESRDNVFVLKSEEIMYYVASVVVI